MNLKCEIVKKVSKKGSEYLVYEITYPNGYKSMIFPASDAEKFIMQAMIDSEKQK